MIEEFLNTFGIPYDPEAAIETLLAWRPNRPLDEMFKITESHLNYASPETKGRHRIAIYSAFMPHNNETVTGENPLARFVQQVPSHKARLEAMFFHILQANPTLFEVCLFVGERFAREEIKRVVVNKFLHERLRAPDHRNKTANTTFRVLRDFSLVTKTSPEHIIWRRPELPSFSYILYYYHTLRSAVAPPVEEILENRYLKASFFSPQTIPALLEAGAGKYWEREQRPPLKRILLRHNSLEGFIAGLEAHSSS